MKKKEAKKEMTAKELFKIHNEIREEIWQTGNSKLKVLWKIYDEDLISFLKLVGDLYKFSPEKDKTKNRKQ